jgi:hypothetical protein
LADAEESKRSKIDPYERSRNNLPIGEDAVVIAGSSNVALAKSIE